LSARVPRESARPQAPARLPLAVAQDVPQDLPPAAQGSRLDTGVPQLRGQLTPTSEQVSASVQVFAVESSRSSPRKMAVPGAWVAPSDDQRPCSGRKEVTENQAKTTRKTTPRAPIVDAAEIVSEPALPEALAQGLASAHEHSQSADTSQRGKKTSVAPRRPVSAQQRLRPATPTLHAHPSTPRITALCPGSALPGRGVWPVASTTQDPMLHQSNARERPARTSTSILRNGGSSTPRNGGTPQISTQSQEQPLPQTKPPTPPQIPPTKTHDQAATPEKRVSAVHLDTSHAAATAARSCSARSARDRDRVTQVKAACPLQRSMSVTQAQEVQLAVQVWARQTQVPRPLRSSVCDPPTSITYVREIRHPVASAPTLVCDDAV